jgi:hypothetical protein
VPIHILLGIRPSTRSHNSKYSVRTCIVKAPLMSATQLFSRAWVTVQFVTTLFGINLIRLGAIQQLSCHSTSGLPKSELFHHSPLIQNLDSKYRF